MFNRCVPDHLTVIKIKFIENLNIKFCSVSTGTKVYDEFHIFMMNLQPDKKIFPVDFFKVGLILKIEI